MKSDLLMVPFIGAMPATILYFHSPVEAAEYLVLISPVLGVVMAVIGFQFFRRRK